MNERVGQKNHWHQKPENANHIISLYNQYSYYYLPKSDFLKTSSFSGRDCTLIYCAGTMASEKH